MTNTIRGTHTTQEEDPEFMEFFSIVQHAASEQDSVFFLWSPECRDGQIGDIWCEDLSGWLLPESLSDEFGVLWDRRDERIWSEEFEPFQAFARWSESMDEKVTIAFEFPLRQKG